MAISCKSESKVLSHEELLTVRGTHHPAIYEYDLKELLAVQGRLRIWTCQIADLDQPVAPRSEGQARCARRPDAAQRGAPAEAQAGVRQGASTREQRDQAAAEGSRQHHADGGRASRAGGSSCQVRGRAECGSYRVRRHAAQSEHAAAEDDVAEQDRQRFASDEGGPGDARCQGRGAKAARSVRAARRLANLGAPHGAANGA